MVVFLKPIVYNIYHMVETTSKATFEGLVQSNKGISVLRKSSGDMIIYQKLPYNLEKRMFVYLGKKSPGQVVRDVGIAVAIYEKEDPSKCPKTTFFELHPEEKGVSIQIENKPSHLNQKDILSKTLAGLEIFDAMLNIPYQNNLEQYNSIAYDYMESSQLRTVGFGPKEIKETEEAYKYMIKVLRLAKAAL